jgi:hypothetical protein
MRPRRLLPRQRATIPSSFLVRALATRGRRHHCANCGEVMFVRYASGLCPLCFNGRRHVALPEPVYEVPPERALVGVLDDPAVEE